MIFLLVEKFSGTDLLEWEYISKCLRPKPLNLPQELLSQRIWSSSQIKSCDIIIVLIWLARIVLQQDEAKIHQGYQKQKLKLEPLSIMIHIIVTAQQQPQPQQQNNHNCSCVETN